MTDAEILESLVGRLQSNRRPNGLRVARLANTLKQHHGYKDTAKAMAKVEEIMGKQPSYEMFRIGRSNVIRRRKPRVLPEGSYGVVLMARLDGRGSDGTKLEHTYAEVAVEYPSEEDYEFDRETGYCQIDSLFSSIIFQCNPGYTEYSDVEPGRDLKPGETVHMGVLENGQLAHYTSPE